MKSEATSNELELSVRIRQYIEKTHESDITPESLTKVFLDNYKPKSEANEAVEFAEFILDNYTQNTIGWHHNNWSGDLETYVNYSPKQLYEIFKTRNKK